MHSSEFKNIMLQFYRITEQLITKESVDEFLLEIKRNSDYIKYIEKWQSLNKIKKLRAMEQEGWVNSTKENTRSSLPTMQMPIRHLIMLKPYIELYTDYIQRNFQEQLIN